MIEPKQLTERERFRLGSFCLGNDDLAQAIAGYEFEKQRAETAEHERELSQRECSEERHLRFRAYAERDAGRRLLLERASLRVYGSIAVCPICQYSEGNCVHDCWGRRARAVLAAEMTRSDPCPHEPKRMTNERRAEICRLADDAIAGPDDTDVPGKALAEIVSMGEGLVEALDAEQFERERADALARELANAQASHANTCGERHRLAARITELEAAMTATGFQRLLDRREAERDAALKRVAELEELRLDYIRALDDTKAHKNRAVIQASNAEDLVLQYKAERDAERRVKESTQTVLYAKDKELAETRSELDRLAEAVVGYIASRALTPDVVRLVEATDRAREMVRAGARDALLKALTPEELAKVVPLSEETIRTAFERGQAEAEAVRAAGRSWGVFCRGRRVPELDGTQEGCEASARLLANYDGQFEARPLRPEDRIVFVAPPGEVRSETIPVSPGESLTMRVGGVDEPTTIARDERPIDWRRIKAIADRGCDPCATCGGHVVHDDIKRADGSVASCCGGDLLYLAGIALRLRSDGVGDRVLCIPSRGEGSYSAEDAITVADVLRACIDELEDREFDREGDPYPARNYCRSCGETGKNSSDLPVHKETCSYKSLMVNARAALAVLEAA